MKNNFKKIIRSAQKLGLSAADKAEMKSTLLRHIEANPLETGAVWYETPKFFSMTFLGRPVERMLVPALVCLFIIGVGGATFASKAALPGDTLYSVKMLNEQVELGLTFDPIKVAKMEEDHAMTRLTEAETLKVQGKLNQETKTKLSDSFNKSSEKTIERIGRVYDNDKEQGRKAFGTFKANVSARKNTLRNISGKEDDDFVGRLSSSTRSTAEKMDALEASTTPEIKDDSSGMVFQKIQERQNKRKSSQILPSQ